MLPVYVRSYFPCHRGNDMIFDMILDFSCCLLSRISHVTLANRQKFGFEFYLRSYHHHLHLVLVGMDDRLVISPLPSANRKQVYSGQS